MLSCHLYVDSKREYLIDLCWSLDCTTHHIAKNKDIRTDEIVTFLEDGFAWIVLRLITDTEDRSLKWMRIEQCKGEPTSIIRIYKTKNPKQHAPPMSSNDNPKPRTKCCSKHSKSKHSRSDQEQIPYLFVDGDFKKAERCWMKVVLDREFYPLDDGAPPGDQLGRWFAFRPALWWMCQLHVSPTTWITT